MRARAIEGLSLWVLGLLGGCAGGALALTFDALRRNAHNGGYADEAFRDMWSWMLASLIAVAVVAVMIALVPVAPRPGAVAALAGAFAVAVAPIDFRHAPRPHGAGLAVLLISPFVVIAAVVAITAARSRDA